VADLVINKPLGLSPAGIEFRRAHLYDFNPVGLGAMVLAATVALCAYAGLLGETAAAFSPFIALAVSMALAPLLAWLTGGRYYLARTPEAHWQPGEVVRCVVCENQFESEDMASCPAYGAAICSLCCSLESRCHDRCKQGSGAADQLRAVAAWLLPRQWALRVNFRFGQYVFVFMSLCLVMAFLVGMVYLQESLTVSAHILRMPFIKVFSLLAMLAAIWAWWVVLSTESRRMAQDESENQTRRLLDEIDAHRRTDAALQTAKDQADSASQAKTRYVAGMTHELRSPLNSILGYTQILLNNPKVDGWMRETLSTMHHSGKHMHALIDGSLELARIEAGRLRLDPVALPLADLLEDVDGIVRPQAEAKGLAFVLEIEGTAPVCIRADAKRLRQILINLLSNSVRFTQYGEIRLRLDFRQHVTRIEVIDSGIGIAPQDQERIFLPFERGSAGRRASETGTGLGLTITNLLTQMMGGDLSVSSTPGLGTTFTLRLYLPDIPFDASRPLVRSLALRSAIGYLDPRRTLLVVDDQPLQRQLLAGLLLPLGFNLIEAASGRECIEIVQQKPPDMVLLDITMDDLDGWETAKLLRALLPPDKLPIVFVSANLFDNEPERLQALECQAFVGKPIIESELLQALERALQLEWVRDNTPLQWVEPIVKDSALTAPQLPDPQSLPQDLKETLQRLARLGNAAALRETLRTALAEQPRQHIATLQHLQERVAQFDFETLCSELRDLDPDPDPDPDPDHDTP
jgi:signal transduction histidine kinase/CheY-like chemotaxis protein